MPRQCNVQSLTPSDRSSYDRSPVQNHATPRVAMLTMNHPPSGKSTLPSYANPPGSPVPLQSIVSPALSLSKGYDRSAVIGSRITIPVRSIVKKPYDANSADLTIRKKSVTAGGACQESRPDVFGSAFLIARMGASLRPGSVAKERGIGGVDWWPAVLRTDAGKWVGARAAGVVGSVGDGLRQVRVEADVGGGWWIQNRTVETAPADVTSLGKGKGVPLKQERGFRVPDRLGRCGGRDRQRGASSESGHVSPPFETDPLSNRTLEPCVFRSPRPSRCWILDNRDNCGNQRTKKGF